MKKTEWITINVNSTAKVRLTEEGIEQFRLYNVKRRNNSSLPSDMKKSVFPLYPRMDDDGYYESPLWIIMRFWGEHLQMGEELPFDTNILVEQL